MRLSPFPTNADRPWRGVWVFAWHTIRQTLRSPLWWAMVVGFPMLIGMVVVIPILFVTDTGGPPPMAVVVSEPLQEHVEAAVEERGGTMAQVVSADPGDDGDYSGVLHVDGTGVDALETRLVVREGEDPALLQDWAERLITETRLRGAVPAGEIDRLRDSWREVREPTRDEAIAQAAKDIRVIGAGVLPLLLVLAAATGVIIGSGNAIKLVIERDEGFFGVLRMGTPSAVLLVGGLLARVVLLAVAAVPFAMLMLPLFVMLAAFEAAGGGLWREIAVLTLLCACTGATSYLTAAGAATAGASVFRGDQQALGFMQTMTMVFTYGSAILLAQAAAGMGELAVAAWSFAPIVGWPFMGKALVGSGFAIWMVPAGLAQGLAALVVLRAGVWAYALDEPPLQELRRLVRPGVRS